MRALSVRQAHICETAAHKRCKCRCKGVGHGRQRVTAKDRSEVQALPADDPHFIPRTAKELRAEMRETRRRDFEARLRPLPTCENLEVFASANTS